MPQPPPQEPTVQRIFEEYTVGAGGRMPDRPAAVAVGTSNIGNPPATIYLLGAIQKFSPAQAIGALGANTLATITIQFGLVEIPAQVVNVGRELRFLASTGVYHNINGLLLQSVQPTLVVTSQGVSISGPGPFPGGVLYDAFSVQVVIKLYSVVATAAGSATVWLDAALYDSPAST